jgi:5-methylcytosine-specific restriction enzyme A
MTASGGWKGERGTRHERGYGAAWDRLRKSILRRDLYLCQPCERIGRTTPAREVDHIIPKANGGTDDDTNLQAICKAHHLEKTQAEAKQAQHGYVKRVIGLDGWPVEG